MSVSLPQIQIIQHHDLNKTEALAITKRIRSQMGDLMREVARAHIGRVWLALDYESWADYIQGEFGHAPLHFPPDQRAAVALLLRKQKMSTRAIGTAMGTDDRTVRRDLSGAAFAAPDLEDMQVTGLDGKTYTVTCDRPEPLDVDVVQPAPSQTITCPTCGGTGKVTQ